MIWIYIVIINIWGLYVIRSDKERAKRNEYRIRERTLFVIAAAGGAFGIWAGMNLFRHKTRKPKFMLGIPALMLVWLILLARHIYFLP